MNVLVFQGSPRKEGNTKQFSDPFMDELRLAGAQVTEIRIYDKHIEPCLGCMICQDVPDRFGCFRQDDMQELFDAVQASDLIVFAVPIYAGFAPGPVKTFMDRLIYAGAKKYGDVKTGSILRGQRCAILLTCGFRPEEMGAAFEFSVKTLCNHLRLCYAGRAGAIDAGRGKPFMSEKRQERARAFARTLLAAETP